MQLLRAIAALLVVLFHSEQAFVRAGAPISLLNEQYLFGFGAVGVHIFFVISGFVMVVSSSFSPAFQPLQFIRRRIIRIYPIYWICAITYLVGHWLIRQPYLIHPAEALKALLLWPGDASKIIGPAWTLSYEMYFYFFFAATMMLGLNRGFLMLASVFISSIFLGFLMRPLSPLLSFLTNSLLLEFLGGAAIGWLYKKRLLPKGVEYPAAALSITIFALGIAVGYDRAPSALVWGCPSALLVLAVVCAEANMGVGAIIKKIGALGGSSYALYLIHIFIITLAVEVSILYPSVLNLGSAVISFTLGLICLIIAEVMHRNVEKPLLVMLKSRSAKAVQLESSI